jgi:hypothetical protein
VVVDPVGGTPMPQRYARWHGVAGW